MTQEQLREEWEKIKKGRINSKHHKNYVAIHVAENHLAKLEAQRQADIAEIEGKIEGEFYEVERGVRADSKQDTYVGGYNAALDSVLTLLQDYKKHEK